MYTHPVYPVYPLYLVHRIPQVTSSNLLAHQIVTTERQITFKRLGAHHLAVDRYFTITIGLVIVHMVSEVLKIYPFLYQVSQVSIRPCFKYLLSNSYWERGCLGRT